MQISQNRVREALEEVLDPELNISIIDLGLVYEVKLQGQKVALTMTLTTIGCPLFGLIEVEVKNKLQQLGFGDKDIQIDLVFDPPWSMERMTEKGKAILGI